MPRKKHDMPVTLAQIAELADIHPSTVSLVLNGRKHERVSVATRERIERIANELGYRVNRHAQGLVRGSTRTVALLLNQLSNPFFGQYVSLLEAQIKGSGYHVMPFETRADTTRERELLTLHRQGVCDLVISLVHYSTAHDDAIANQPVVLRLNTWDAQMVNACRAPYVAVDYRPALRTLLGNLERSGRKHFGLVMHTSNAPFDNGKFASPYSRTLRSMLDKSSLRCGADSQAVAHENDDLQVWHERAFQLLKSQPTIDALLVHTTGFVAPVIEAARKAGRTIGRDLALAAFDDPPFAAWIEGGVTVVREPVERVAAGLGKLALAVLKGKPLPGAEVIEAELVERHSTCPEIRAGVVPVAKGES